MKWHISTGVDCAIALSVECAVCAEHEGVFLHGHPRGSPVHQPQGIIPFICLLSFTSPIETSLPGPSLCPDALCHSYSRDKEHLDRCSHDKKDLRWSGLSTQRSFSHSLVSDWGLPEVDLFVSKEKVKESALTGISGQRWRDLTCLQRTDTGGCTSTRSHYWRPRSFSEFVYSYGHTEGGSY